VSARIARLDKLEAGLADLDMLSREFENIRERQHSLSSAVEAWMNAGAKLRDRQDELDTHFYKAEAALTKVWALMDDSFHAQSEDLRKGLALLDEANTLADALDGGS
jgi:predicted  nucleic acid-binding Zn-ribbon protein